MNCEYGTNICTKQRLSSECLYNIALQGTHKQFINSPELRNNSFQFRAMPQQFWQIHRFIFVTFCFVLVFEWNGLPCICVHKLFNIWALRIWIMKCLTYLNGNRKIDNKTCQNLPLSSIILLEFKRIHWEICSDLLCCLANWLSFP